MRFFYLCLLLLISTEVFAQQEEASAGFVHLSQVQKPPFSTDCNVNAPICTTLLIQDYVAENLPFSGPLTNGTSGKTEVTARVIIDISGKVSWASVKGLPSETGKELEKKLKEMPAFIPGEHEGQKTNVIVDLIVPFYVWERDNYSTKVVHHIDAEEPLVWDRCKRSKDKKSCTIDAVNHWMNRNVNTRNVDKAGFYATTARFIIDKDGEVSRIVIYGGGDELAPEVLRTIKKIPRFEPARVNDEPVAVYFILPITVNISKT